MRIRRFTLRRGEPDPAFHFDADAVPDLAYHKRDVNLSLHSSILSLLFVNFDFDADPDTCFHFHADPDPTFHCNTDPFPAYKNGADPYPAK